MSAIPLPLEKSFFKETEGIFRNVTWNNKTPRVSLKNLYVERKKGRLGLPNVRNYYIALNSRFPLKLGYGWDSRNTRWESIEQEAWDKSKDGVTLQGLWYGPIWKDIDNPLIEFSCTMGKTFQNVVHFNHFNVKNSPSAFPQFPEWETIHKWRMRS